MTVGALERLVRWGKRENGIGFYLLTADGDCNREYEL